MKTVNVSANWLKAILRRAVLAVTIACVFLTASLSLSKPASAYPIFAQQQYENPREATGRLACANCHLAKKPTEVEVPQSVLPDTVFEAVVKVPYDKSIQQVAGDGSKTGLNVGAVVVLPEGFTLAPEDRLTDEQREEVNSMFIQPYSEDKPNILVVGPLPGDQYEELKFPILAPDPNEDDAIEFGKYQIHVGGNRGRGQVYPTGEKSNNTVYTASQAGTIAAIAQTEDGGYSVTIQGEKGTAEDVIPPGPSLIVAEGDEVAAGAALTNNPNVGGFGQADVEIVLQDPNRILGLLAFFAIATLAQILLVLKKKQVERVQAAEMNF
ncbi:cytochrome f [Alkalinema sp. FACHB-956]|uniref:cytochrome f n=1 Tax=Alkalinema sp. FACHB-956 TaxID=2692768 RepID=UPI00168606CD|nr:apocytochrome f [Alkalinema sp. FACHB-956]MBD2326292.1 apocytochrome f [Alkalinema sp. FACHB-956]